MLKEKKNAEIAFATHVPLCSLSEQFVLLLEEINTVIIRFCRQLPSSALYFLFKTGFKEVGEKKAQTSTVQVFQTNFRAKHVAENEEKGSGNSYILWVEIKVPLMTQLASIASASYL